MPFFTNDELQLHYREMGDGSLVILLPGNTASSAHFQADLQRLSTSYHAVSLDFRGTGQSGRLDQFLVNWAEKCAGDLAALIAHLGSQEATLIGTSGGAMIALLCARQYPEQVKAVIADSFIPHWSVEFLQGIVAGRELALKDEGASQFWAFGHGADWQAVVEKDSRWLQALAAAGGLDIVPILSDVRCPVLLTGTANDSQLPDLVPQMMTALQKIPQSELYICHTGDHPLIWSSPSEFWSVADSFLQRVMRG